MSYEPREGIDYIVDFYAVAGVEPETDANAINKAINKQLSQYHPDRLSGLAPEIQARGERMSRLLNKARGILVVPEKRTQYDEIRSGWTGPLSKTGDPVIAISRAVQAEMAMKSTEEIEESFAHDDEQVDKLANYSQTRLDFLEKMMAAAGDNVPDDLREQYEEALLEYDRNLSIKEAQRGDLLGLADLGGKGYRASLSYGDEKVLELEAAKEVQLEELRAIAMGKTVRKLELLSGEVTEPSTELVDLTTIQLPDYFDTVAEQVKGIAEKRQTVAEKRLDNYQPTYPEAELQRDPKSFAAFGFMGESKITWFSFSLDLNKGSFDAIVTPDDVMALLQAGDYKAVIGKDFNVALLPVLEQLELMDLLNEGINKYVNKYYPDDDEPGEGEA
jgi:curved DNA-binding protein CbpA